MVVPELAERVVVFLNELAALDPNVLTELIEHRVPCNAAFAEHPTVQCTASPATVVLLGILNGLCGVNENGIGFVAAQFSAAGALERFLITPSSVTHNQTLKDNTL